MTEKRKQGRPPKWSNHIKAPPDAIRLYKLIEELQTSTAFRECHPFKGAILNHVPVISWHNRVTALPKIILGFLGIPYRKQLCATHGCANPFHYADLEYKTNLETLKGPDPVPHISSSLEGYIELIEYYMEKEGFENLTPTFDNLRRHIPIEDISDVDLRLAIEKMTHHD